MYNIILIIMLISLIYNYIFKRHATYDLNCGIFAWTGTSSDRFSPYLFNVLGIYNDARGGDSCGVYFNKGVITGTKTEAKYENLVKKQKLHTTIKPGRWPVVIGHCRKASVGSISDGNAQPILLRTIKDNKLVYVQAHNGTIINHQALATKYNITIEKDESDSIVLAKLIERVGFKVLSEYEGSAALVINLTKEPNTLYAFHGQSKNYSTLSEERPLHYITIPESGVYISSEAPPLEWISNGDEAIAFKHNIVYKIQGDTVEEFMKIERESAVMKKWDNTSNYKEVDLPFNNINYNSAKTNYEIIRSTGTKNIVCSMIDFNLVQTHNNFKIRYSKGFFVHDKTYAHGERLLDTWGYIRDPDYNKSKFTLYYLYFYYGILLSDSDAWEEVNEAGNKLGISSHQDFYTPNKFNAMNKVISSNSLFPFTRVNINPGSGYMEPSSFYPNQKIFADDTFYTGDFVPLFSECELHFKEGDFIGYRKIYGGTYTISDLLRENPVLQEWGFGDQLKEEKILVKDCSDCVDKGIYDNGNKCLTCTLDFEKSDEEAKKEEDKYEKENYDDNKVTMYHTISSQVNPILGDLEDLIIEIQTSGFSTSVSEELNLLIEANDKLKSIVK